MRKSIYSAICILILSTPLLAFASELSVQISGGTEKIDYFTEQNIVYFSMSQFAELMGEKLSWVEAGLSVSYETEKNKVLLFVNFAYSKINDTITNITYPAILRGGQLYLPAVTFIPLLDRLKSEQISWDAGNKTIRVSSEWYTVNDILFSQKANGLLIEIFVAGPTKYEIFTSEGNWLNINIPDGTINRQQIMSRRSGEFLLDINTHQFDNSAQLALQLRPKIGKFSDRFQSNPDRIQIALLDTSATVEPKSGPDSVGPDELIDRVIIDAGHGGNDYGAIGFKSTKEKEIVLDIAKRLAKLIRKEKIFEAIMTRDKDEALTLQERAKIANKAKGDIFVSIHANASTKRSARGFQVFFLAPAKNDSARAAAQLENAPFLAETSALTVHEDSDLGFIISDMIQTEFQTESSDLAAIIDKECRRALTETSARGIDQAGFFVLNGVYMPSVLIETAFITNREDEEILNNKSYRQNVAEAIYEGLKRFKAKYENK